jgi:hypothetical protein
MPVAHIEEEEPAGRMTIPVDCGLGRHNWLDPQPPVRCDLPPDQRQPGRNRNAGVGAVLAVAAFVCDRLAQRAEQLLGLIAAARSGIDLLQGDQVGRQQPDLSAQQPRPG